MESENTIPENGKKKFIIITPVVILVVAGLIVGYFFIKKYNQQQAFDATLSTVNELREVPRSLSVEEKALIEERMNASSTSLLTKKESTAITQKTQNTEGYTALTDEQRDTLQKRILIQ